MNVFLDTVRYLDRLEPSAQLGWFLGLLLLDAATFQIVGPWLWWYLGSHQEAFWVFAGSERYFADWFFHLLYWFVLCGLFGLAYFPSGKFFRVLTALLLVVIPLKVCTIIGYVLAIVIFNDGCPTYEIKEDGHYSECIQRGVGFRT